MRLGLVALIPILLVAGCHGTSETKKPTTTADSQKPVIAKKAPAPLNNPMNLAAKELGVAPASYAMVNLYQFLRSPLGVRLVDFFPAGDKYDRQCLVDFLGRVGQLGIFGGAGKMLVVMTGRQITLTGLSRCISVEGLTPQVKGGTERLTVPGLASAESLAGRILVVRVGMTAPAAKISLAQYGRLDPRHFTGAWVFRLNPDQIAARIEGSALSAEAFTADVRISGTREALTVIRTALGQLDEVKALSPTLATYLAGLRVTGTGGGMRVSFSLPAPRFSRILQAIDLMKLSICTDPVNAKTFSCPEISQKELSAEVASSEKRGADVTRIRRIIGGATAAEAVLKTTIRGSAALTFLGDMSLITSSPIIKRAVRISLRRKDACIAGVLFGMERTAVIYAEQQEKLVMWGRARGLGSKLKGCAATDRTITPLGKDRYKIPTGSDFYTAAWLDDDTLLISSGDMPRITTAARAAFRALTLPPKILQLSFDPRSKLFKEIGKTDRFPGMNRLQLAFLAGARRELVGLATLNSRASTERLHTVLAIYSAMLRKEYPNLLRDGLNPFSFSKDTEVLASTAIGPGSWDLMSVVMEFAGAGFLRGLKEDIAQREREDALKAACARKRPDCHALALFQIGQKGDKGLARGVRQLEDNCKKNLSSSCLTLGNLYINGRGVKASRTRAYSLMMKACRRGDDDACTTVGDLWGTRGKTAGDRKLGEAALRSACDRRKGDFCFSLVRLFLSREGLKGFPRSLPYLKRGCDLGHTASCHTLATYLTADGLGRKTKPDHVKGLKLLTRACDRGYMASCNNIGDMYEKGRGVKPNLGTALRYYGMACAKKLGIGCAGMADVYLRQKRFSEAVKYQVEACKLGFGRSCRDLAVLHEQGVHVKKDTALAKKLYQLACMKGYKAACGK